MVRPTEVPFRRDVEECDQSDTGGELGTEDQELALTNRDVIDDISVSTKAWVSGVTEILLTIVAVGGFVGNIILAVELRSASERNRLLNDAYNAKAESFGAANLQLHECRGELKRVDGLFRIIRERP